jgi:hypothetical protein
MRQTLRYASNVPEWSHPKPEVNRALLDAWTAGLQVVPSHRRGGHWGKVHCNSMDCALQPRTYVVSSTPGNQHDEASRIRRFARRHEHKEDHTPRQAGHEGR